LENKRLLSEQEHKLKLGNMDYILLFTVIALTLIGVVMVFSSSYYSTGTSAKFGYDSYFFLRREIRYSVLGFILLFALSKFPYQNFQNWNMIMYAVIVFLLFIVLILGKTSNGATRWIMGIQPSEIAKIILIIVLSNRIAVRSEDMDNFLTFSFCVAMVGVPIILILSQNMSTGLVVTAVCGGIMLISTRKVWYFLPWAILAIIGLTLFILLGDEFRRNRIMGWLNPDSQQQDINYQNLQGLYAVGSGGLFGVGLGNSRQKLGFIPEAHNDIIFAVICEELGAVGAGIILLLYIIMIWRCVKIALDATSLFGTLVAAGVAIMVGVQVFVNVSVVTKVLPNTGIPLPFISYGGTSLITFMISMGIVLNISRHYRE